ncbi:DUF1127 domain-containing protein [Jeongeupia chitinilytica]|uniref:DUF1127 domain-containing protein n=1 Tax=Jeongeupia chitinilytica TaxID=1041641 RepID=UPI001671A10E|nr:DUF1127 domain-containing protein [Jeongeupia chitinilytica]
MNEDPRVDKMGWQELGLIWPSRPVREADDGLIGGHGAAAMKRTGWWQRWRQRRRLASELAELRGMSGYQLGDLGIAASDIDAIAAGTFEAQVSRAKKNPAGAGQREEN